MIYQKKHESLLGTLLLQSDGTVLTGLCFAGSEDAEKLKSSYEEKHLSVFTETEKWLDTYFDGRNPGEVPPYCLVDATPFKKAVLAIVAEIPYGQTVTYGDIAERIAKKAGLSKMSAQAVGGAVGWNPLCLVIPCHRVVGAGGNLTGYGGGIKKKAALLELEGNDMNGFFFPKGTKK